MKSYLLDLTFLAAVIGMLFSIGAAMVHSRFAVSFVICLLIAIITALIAWHQTEA